MTSGTTKAVNEYLSSVKNCLGPMPNDERSAVLDNLEAQIYESLKSRCGDNEPTVDDVKAVLSEMDPPEAFVSARPEASGAGPRPVVGKVALYISAIGIILSILSAAWWAASKKDQQFAEGVAMTIMAAAVLAIPSQIITLIVAAFSRGDKSGRKAIIISISWFGLWVLLMVGGMIFSHA